MNVQIDPSPKEVTLQMCIKTLQSVYIPSDSGILGILTLEFHTEIYKAFFSVPFIWQENIGNNDNRNIVKLVIIYPYYKWYKLIKIMKRIVDNIVTVV